MISVRSSFLICPLKALTDSADLMNLCSLEQLIKGALYLKLHLNYGFFNHIDLAVFTTEAMFSLFQKVFTHKNSDFNAISVMEQSWAMLTPNAEHVTY